MPAKRTPEQIDESVKGRPLTRVGEYRNYDTKIEWKCHQCEHIWEATPNNVITKGSGCPVCSEAAGGKKKSASQKDRVSQHLTAAGIELVTPYTRVSDHHIFKCNVCSHQWTTALNNLMNTKSGCPACVGLNRLTNESIDQKLSHQDRNITRLTDVVNATTKIQWKCDKDHVWKATPDSVLNAGSGCKLCKRGHGKGLQFRHILNKDPMAANMPTILYVLRFTNKTTNDVFIKVGVTTLTIADRFKAAEYRNYTIETLKTTTMGLKDAVAAESILCNQLKPFRHTITEKFGGRTECFTDHEEVRSVLLV